MRALKLARSYSIAVLWTLLVACGGKSAQTSAAPVALSDVPAKAVAAFCTGYGNCCASKGFAFNATLCSVNANNQLDPASICPAPGVYDPQAAGDCIAELQAAYSACSLSNTAISACGRMCNGTAAPGASCTRDSDCAQPAVGTVSCTFLNASSAGLVCVVDVPGKEGDACSATCTTSAEGNDRACNVFATSTANPQPGGTVSCYTNDGLYCNGNYVCQPLAAIGSSCTASGVCISSAYCDFTTNRCAAKGALGASCSDAFSCGDGMYCTTAQVCAAKKAAGATCQTPLECQVDCDSITQLCVNVDTAFGLDVTAASCANPTPN